MVDTDYLVIGAGAAGMAFADAVVADSDAEVVMVDRRAVPGGHWNDAYSFVHLHQPAAYYGVNSRPLGDDAIDEAGSNAGMYELATAPQICDYYRRVLDEHLVPSGQVRFLGMSEYVGDALDDDVGTRPADGSRAHAVVSRLTGATTTVRVRKKVVDARYLEPVIPSTHTPTFRVDPDATFIPVNDLARVAEAPSGYTIIGCGKTGIDACLWLLANGVDPDRIRWVRPRDAWLLDRMAYQPLGLVTNLVDGFSLATEASAEAESTDDLMARLEASGQFLRIDPTVTPTMFHSAMVSRSDLDALRSIEDVVRLGHVTAIGSEAIAFDDGEIPTDRGHVHVDCSAPGLRPTAGRPVFEGGRITLQPVRTATPPFNAALAGYIEVSRDEEAQKARLCPTNTYPNRAADWIPNMRITLEVLNLWGAEPDVAAWLERSRTNIARGMFDHGDDPRMGAAFTRLIDHSDAAISNLSELELAGRRSGAQ